MAFNLVSSKLQLQRLRSEHRSHLVQHYLSLSSESRFSRFGVVFPDHAILNFVGRIDFSMGIHFGIFDQGILVGVAQLSPWGDRAKSLEFGVSVAEDYRNKGLGSRLWEVCENWALENDISHIQVLHADTNSAIIGLCRKFELTVHREDGERIGVWSHPTLVSMYNLV